MSKKLTAYECWEKSISENLSTDEYRQLLKENGIIQTIDSYIDATFPEMPRKHEFTGVLTRDGEQICVGHKVDTVQGTMFDVIRLEHATGVKYALHDGTRPYDLEPFMSPNLWLVR
jgi:hypothetical protein